MNNFKTKVYDLDVDKLKTVSVALKKLSDLVSKENVERTAYNKHNTKLNNFEIKIPDVMNLIRITNTTQIIKVCKKELMMLIKSTR